MNHIETKIELDKVRNIRDSAISALQAILKTSHLEDAKYIAHAFLKESHNGKKL